MPNTEEYWSESGRCVFNPDHMSIYSWFPIVTTMKLGTKALKFFVNKTHDEFWKAAFQSSDY